MTLALDIWTNKLLDFWTIHGICSQNEKFTILSMFKEYVTSKHLCANLLPQACDVENTLCSIQ